MKILRVFLVTTFLISLLAGFTAGTFFFQYKIKSAQTSSVNTGVNHFPGKQENIWIIVVDRLNIATPKIVGIWLFAYIPNYTSIKPLPLYPSDNSQQDADLVNAFRVTSDRKVAPEFWNYLQNHNYPAQDYIVFDEIAVASIINIFGGVSVQGKHLSGLEALAQLPKTWDDPRGSLHGQITLMDSVCKSILNSHTFPDMFKLQIDVRKHITSNLDMGKKSKEWQTMIASGNRKVCDFVDLYEKIQLTSKP
jgi:hypothetical protein